jgi:hypothetical protein
MVQHRRAWGWGREIPTVRCSEKLARLPNKGASDHTTHSVLTDQKFSGGSAHLIQIRYGDHLFVGSDLEDTVSRRVHNRMASLDVLTAQFLDDDGP